MSNEIIWFMSCLWLPAFTLSFYKRFPTGKLLGIGIISFIFMLIFL